MFDFVLQHLAHDEIGWLPGFIGETDWHWEPSATVDLGLRSTKSANSVILSPLNLSHVFLENHTFFESCKLRPETPPKFGAPAAPPNAYSDWLRTPWYCPSDIKLTVGPKAEFDRNFKRKNVLGSVRIDFNFERWLGSISKRRYLIEQSFKSQPKDITDNVRLSYGLSIVPFIAFDFGGHVNNETVKKMVGANEISVLVPRHRIFRSYLGFTSTFEVNKLPRPITLTIEEWLVHLAARETIGFTTDDGAFLKQLRGFHHRGKATLAFALDPSKHYNLTVEFENGRQAPNFEYLNKVVTGVKIQY